jgi:hypothetical protein
VPPGLSIVTADAGMSCELMDARVKPDAYSKVDIPCDTGIRSPSREDHLSERLVPTPLESTSPQCRFLGPSGVRARLPVLDLRGDEFGSCLVVAPVKDGEVVVLGA